MADRGSAGSGSGSWRRRLGRCIGIKTDAGDPLRTPQSMPLNFDAHAARRAGVQESLVDRLTGLPSLILFVERVGQALVRANESGTLVAVLDINIDGFRIFNDAKGMKYGDVLLQVVADRLQETIDGSDVISRIRADEYGVLCAPVVDEDEAFARAERILDSLKRPFVLSDGDVIVGASIGIAFNDAEISSVGIIGNAEVALHSAKLERRSSIKVYNDEIRTQAKYRLALDTALRYALEREELFVVFQPIASLKDRVYVGVEALVRWDHPELGVIGPQEFIPIAEETGLIAPIGKFVLETSCRQLQRWREISPKANDWRMSINVSASQLKAPGFPEMISHVLGETNLSSSDLRIEVTESALVDGEVATEVLRRLRELGVRISIDDFGTKYSSLSYITRLPIDELKIDRSFIDDLVDNESLQAVVSAILTIGRSLGLTVTAEGVETQAQLIQLLMLGCDSAQGYLFERPLSPDACFAALSSPPRPPLGQKWM